MPVTRHRVGGVTSVLHGDLEGYVRRAAEAAAGGALEVMERAAGEVRTNSRADWYRLVERETGKSGDIDVVTTVDTDRSRVVVTVGSTDERTAGKAGKPLVVFVRSPAADSLVPVVVDRRTWYATAEALRGPIWLGDDIYRPTTVGGKAVPVPEERLRYTIYKRNPKASSGGPSGQFLLQSLVRAPMKRKVKEIAPEVARAIAERIKRGARG